MSVIREISELCVPILPYEKSLPLVRDAGNFLAHVLLNKLRIPL